MDFNFYKQKQGLYAPSCLSGRKCKKKDLVREFTIECDDVDDLTFQHNVMCWANKVKVTSRIESRNMFKEQCNGVSEVLVVVLTLKFRNEKPRKRTSIG